MHHAFLEHVYLLVRLVGLGGLLEERREDAVSPLEGRKIVRSVQFAQSHGLRVNHQWVDLTNIVKKLSPATQLGQQILSWIMK